MQATALPDDQETLHSPLLAYAITLCRKYGYPEHVAEDFVQEMWARSFRRIDPKRERGEVYHYLRTRLLGLFRAKKQAQVLQSMWRVVDDRYPHDLSRGERALIGVD